MGKEVFRASGLWRGVGPGVGFRAEGWGRGVFRDKGESGAALGVGVVA